jgi:hypothetical protein
MKKLAILALAVATLIIVAGLSSAGSSNSLTVCEPPCKGVVDKRPKENFVVEITFKNTGTDDGTWSVNTAFEGEKWTWTGKAKELTLDSNDKKTLTWEGTVPANASVGSVARLVVYYNDSFQALDWWIHVVPGAELSITSSTVR